MLWDLLPDGKQLGGAPANFAYITRLLGDDGIPLSRVGHDSLGEEARSALGRLGLSDAFIQRDEQYPTGTVEVEVDAAGQPTFQILKPVAWDFLQWSDELQRLAVSADAVCFGSLAQRSPVSRTTIRSFVRAARAQAVRVFDVNLRQDFYTREIVEESIQHATIVKLNHEELPKITRLSATEPSELKMARDLLERNNLKLVCVTRGSRGSLLISQQESHEHKGYTVKVADTVGAGDAFTAALVHGYMRGHSLAEINDRANRAGAWVASQSGGMPPVPSCGLEIALARIA